MTRAALQHLVLVGGGHSHVEVLRRFGRQPLDGARITLVSRDVVTPYSGMLPGVVAGHYTPEQAHIDLESLARVAGASAVFGEAVALDLAARRVLVRGGRSIPYDVLSINVGSTPRVDVPGAERFAIAVKPIDRFLERWTRVRDCLRQASTPTRLAVVGGGAGGVELLLAAQYQLRRLLEHDGRDASHLTWHLFTASAEILPTHNARVRRIFERILSVRQVIVHAASPVTQVLDRGLLTADGVTHAVDEILWTTEAGAAAWLADSNLDVDDDGFVRVSSTFESLSHANVFAAGDVAAMVEHPRPKSGVFAVRAGPPLAGNLRRALLGRPRVGYRPQRQFLGLISTGDKYAVASRGPFAVEGAWVWRWKDWIDRRFMSRYDVGRDAVRAGRL